MPCNCVGDNPKYPQNEEWGPTVWRILHTLAERGGLQKDKLLQADEGRSWPLFVKTLGPMLPCPYCRDHLAEWMIYHPFNLPTENSEWNFYIRTWFYELHESVNARLQKPSFSFDQLKTTYNNTRTIQADMDFLEKIQLRAMKLGGVNLLAWQAWQKHFRNLRALI